MTLTPVSSALGPVEEKFGAFLATPPEFPFQQGNGLDAAGISYNSRKAMDAMRRLHQLDKLSLPSN